MEVPSRIADLGFSFLLPDDFRAVPLPDEQPRFDEPGTFFPLTVAMAGYAAIVFSVAARPAYEDGTLTQWLTYLCAAQQMEHSEIEPAKVGAHEGVACFARQQSEAGPMKMRLCLFEDGGRMVNVSVMSPEPLWGSVADKLRTMIDSFALSSPRGSQVAVV